MKREFLQPFLTASKMVSEDYFGEKVTSEELSREKNLFLKEQKLILIAIQGDLNGLVLFGFDDVNAKKMIENKLKLELPEDDDEEFIAETLADEKEIESAIKEFGNQVVGRVVGLYEKEGFECRISTPTLIPTTDYLGEMIRNESIHVVFETASGEISLKLAIEEK